MHALIQHRIKSIAMFVDILFSALHTHHIHLVSCLYMYVHISYIHTHLLYIAG